MFRRRQNGGRQGAKSGGFKGKSGRSKSELSPAELKRIGEPNLYSIAVDAASSGNPGRMEYQGVDTQTGKLLFHQGPYQQGTNNVRGVFGLSPWAGLSQKRGQ